MAHTLVVGGGLAGLAAATYVARGGVTVTLLEKSPQIGGRAISDTPRGYALNRGGHALYTGGSASMVLSELGVRYSSGVPKRLFALDDSGLHPFPSDAFSLFRTRALGAGDKPELMRVLLRISALRPASLANQSVADFISEQTRRGRVRKILTSLARVSLYTAALDIVSADVFLVRLQQTLKHPVHYVEGGWQTIVDGLLEAAVAAGVRIQTSSSAAGVHVQDGKARAVQLRDGAHLDCDYLILAVPPDDAFTLLGGPPLFHSVAANVACLDLALSRLPSKDHPIVFNLEKPLFLTAQSEFARLAPEGGAVVHLLKQLDPRVTSDAESDRADMESFMDQIQPGWRDVAIEQRFLPHMLGSSTLPLVSTGGLAGRPSHQSHDVHNVYFAGDWIGPRGYLADTVLNSARASARQILQEAGVLAQAA